MDITVKKIEKDIILTIQDDSVLENFTGYRLERRTAGGSWYTWTSNGWVEGGDPLLLTSNRFTDYDLSDGIYQYRYCIAFSVGDPSNWQESEWVNIGYDKLGWTFGNYHVPEDQFGEVLTVDDIRFTYLWGIDFRASNGEIYTDEQIKHQIKATAQEFERALNLSIFKKKIVCQPSSDVDYDIAEDPYPFRGDRWIRAGKVILRRRPVISVERFELYSIVDQKILDLLPWIRLDHRKGVLNFFPKVGPSGVIGANPYLLTAGMPLRSLGNHYPHGYKIDYTAGFEDAGKIPEDLRDIIAKGVACKLLNVIGDGLIAGFSSSSISLDGVSESFSSTQSATNAYFGARIQVYLKDIENYIKNYRYKFGHFVIGSI